MYSSPARLAGIIGLAILLLVALACAPAATPTGAPPTSTPTATMLVATPTPALTPSASPPAGSPTASPTAAPSPTPTGTVVSAPRTLTVSNKLAYPVQVVIEQYGGEAPPCVAPRGGYGGPLQWERSVQVPAGLVAPLSSDFGPPSTAGGPTHWRVIASDSSGKPVWCRVYGAGLQALDTLNWSIAIEKPDTSFPIPPSTPAPTATPYVGQVDARLASAQTRFGIGLFNRLFEDAAGKNVVVSPSSVALALAMTYNGAAGDTQKAMSLALELQGMSLADVNAAAAAWRAAIASADPKVQMDVANSLWVRQGVQALPDFLQRNRESFGAQVTDLDFGSPGAADTINRWVSDNTNGKIPGIVEPPIDPQTVMFLINAIYFKGEWKTQFDPKLTAQRAFTTASGAQVQAPMMTRTGKALYYKGDGFQSASLPYGSGRFAMDVFVPDAGVSLDSLLSKVSEDGLKAWASGLKEQEIELALPRFKVEYEASLNDALKAMGMAVAFDPQKADFTAMFSREALGPNNAYISNVKHKTFLEVNEEGTEAAAATSVEIGVTSIGPEKPRVIADHPFFLTIRDAQTGSVLFMGAIQDPS